MLKAKVLGYQAVLMLLVLPFTAWSFSGSVQHEAGSVLISDSGILRGTSDINVQTGAFTYKYPILVPPGRGEMTPELSLSYDSGDRKSDSVFGFGWSSPIPTIQRLNKTGIADMYANNTFSSDLDGELRTTDGAHFSAKIERGEFRDYEYDGNGWVVTDKAGVEYRFGNSSASRVEDPDDSARVFVWYLDEIRDLNGNYVRFSYHKDNNQLYPDTISYTGHGSVDGIYSVHFTRELRPDPQVSYTSGFRVQTLYRISQIQIEENGSWIQRYELNYDLGENGTRSLLTSITETGRNGQVTNTFPATAFEYSAIDLTEQSWSDANTFSVPEVIIGGRQSQDRGTRFFDVNGDGYADLVVYRDDSMLASGDVTEKVYLNQGSSWEADSSWSLPKPSGEVAFTSRDAGGWHDMGARFTDVNGDGYTDIVWSIYSCFVNAPCQHFRKVYINNTVDGWDEDPSWVWPSDVYFTTNQVDTGGGNELVDVNGDGLVDIVKATRYTTNGGGLWRYTYKTYLNTGAGWVEAGDEWDSPEILESQGMDAGTRFADINGDGLTDILRHVDTDYSDPEHGVVPVDVAYLNTGAGWELAPEWKSPLPFLNQFLNYGPKTRSTRLVDVNGDGLVDLFANEEGTFIDQQEIYINTGSGWSRQTTNWEFAESTLLNYAYGNYWIADAGVRLVDFDGDNMIDFVKNGTIDTYPNDPVYVNQVLIHKASVPDLITSITDSTGGVIQTKYQQSAQYVNGGELENKTISKNFDTVRSVTKDSGFGDVVTTSYEYSDGDYFYESPQNRHFAGFGQVTKTTNLSEEVTYYHQGNSDNLPDETGDSEARIGLAYKQAIYQSTAGTQGELLNRTFTEYQDVDRGSDTTFVAPAAVVTESHGGGTHDDSAIEYSYDAVGNIIEVRELGEVASDSTGGYVDIGSDDRTTTYSYAHNGSGDTTSYVAREELRDSNNAVVARTEYEYDNLSLGSVGVGNMTTQREFANTGTAYESDYTYDSYGNVLTETDPKNNTTSYTYDPYNLYPTSVTNELNQVTQYTYDYRTGEIASKTDPNGVVWSYTFDGFGRPLTESIPNPSSGGAVLAREYQYTDTSGAYSIKLTEHINSTLSRDTYTYLDGFGREVQTRSQAEDGNQFAVIDTVYGNAGLVEKKSLPYFSGGTGRTSVTSNNALYSRYSYDGLGRVVNTQTTVGDTTKQFVGWKEVVADPLGNQKTYERDAFGRLAAVTEHENGSSYITNYDWGARDDLERITDAAGNERSLTYDWLSRRLNLEDVHDPADTTFGVWSYVYDQNGNVTSQTNPSGDTATYTYDDLDRILTEDNSDSAGVEFVYSYDSCFNGIGRLCQVTGIGNETTYGYDNIGNVSYERKQIAGTGYEHSYEYDRAGNQTNITYPDNSEVRYTYNTAGLLESIEQLEADGSSFAPVISDFDYGPHGLVTYQRHGNGVETFKNYDAGELYRLRNITTTAVDNVVASAETPLVFAARRTNDRNTTTNPEGGDVTTLPDSTDTTTEDLTVLTDPASPTELTSPEPADVTTDGAVGSVEEMAATTQSASLDSSSLLVQAASVSGPTFGNESVGSRVVDSSSDFRGSLFVAPADYASFESLSVYCSAVRLRTSEFKAVIVDHDTLAIVPGGVSDPVTCTDAGGWHTPTFSNTPQLTAGKEYLLGGIMQSPRGYLHYESGSSNQGHYDSTNSYLIPKDLGSATHNTDRYSIYITYQSGTPQPNNPPTANAGGDQVVFDADDSGDEVVVLDGTASTDSDGTIVSHEWYEGTTLLGNGATLNTTLGVGTHTIDLVVTDDDGDTDTDSVVVTVDPYVPAPNQPPVANAGIDQTLNDNDDTGVEVAILNGSASTDSDGTIVSYEWGEGGILLGTSELLNVSLAVGTHNIDLTVTDDAGAADTDSLIVTVNPYTPTPNNPPTANAGTDQTISDADDSGDESIMLDGTASNDSDGTIVSHEWYEGTTLLGNGATLNTTLGVGTHTIDLVVTDDDGAQSTDQMLVTISPFVAPPDPGEAVVLFTEDFQTDLSAWTFSGELNWQIDQYSEEPLPNAPQSNLIGNAADCETYCTLTLATPLDLTAYTSATLSYWRYVDNGLDNGEYLLVEVYDGSSWQEIGYFTNGAGDDDEWIQADMVLDEYISDEFRIRFTERSSSSGEDVDLDDIIITAVGGDTDPPPEPPTNSPQYLPTVQDLTYTYDAVGNITSIVDASDTDSAGTVEYAYDDLYRLTSAATQNAVTDPYTRTYSYDALGNIQNKSDQGTYSYAGNQGSSYANPHAATQIGSVSYTYDRNGNLLSTSDGRTNSWDFNNRLITSDDGAVPVSYEYDHTGQRIRKDGTTDTIYASRLYEEVDGVPTKHIYAGDMLVATIEGSGVAPDIRHAHLDHLNSSKVTTNADGHTTQMLDQYPFGGSRIDTQLDDTNQLNRFTGHDYDEETALNYMGARYQSGDEGRFSSQDPANIDLGSVDWEEEYQRPLEVFLSDPQQLNTYSYSRNNPVLINDPEGEIIPLIIGAWAAVEVGLAVYDAYTTIDTLVDPNASNGEKVAALGGFAIGAIAPGGGYGTAGKAVVNKVDDIADVKKTYQTYTKTKVETGEVYTGRTSGYGTPLENIRKRDTSHHMNGEGFGPAVLDKSSSNRGAIRGREQLMIDYNGGAKSQGGVSGNKINGISPQNTNLQKYIEAAKKEFGRK